MCLLRATCASIGDDADARMPLAYVHLVQIHVDTLIVLAPFALYPRLGALTIPLFGILTIFYRGFLVRGHVNQLVSDGAETPELSKCARVRVHAEDRRKSAAPVRVRAATQL